MKATQKNNCFYCSKDQRLHDKMIEIIQLESSTLYLNKDQTHKGRCILAFNHHVKEIHELSPKEMQAFSYDLQLISRAIEDVLKPDKINCAIYGDIVSHLHVHIVPKHKTHPEWGDAFVNNPTIIKEMSNFEYSLLINKIKRRLQL